MGRSSAWLLAAASTLALVNCADDAQTASLTADLVELNVESGEAVRLTANIAEPTAVVVTFDCGRPQHPDDTRALIKVSGEAFPVAEALEGQARADHWSWAGELPAGQHEITVENVGNTPAACRINMVPQAVEDGDDAVCTSWSTHRSMIDTATHIPVGNLEYGEWEDLPASGNHWGAWAMWNRVYEAPVLRGFYLHNLEHGGLVLSYGCESADESPACADAEAQLVELASKFGQNRILVTPDPNQPEMFSVRAWRWAFSGDCLNEDAALEFMTDHFRQGREDIEAGPLQEFDPTSTENVPCEILMAAPDSC